MAIDPGLANTGIVLFVDGRIVDARTAVTDGNADTDAFAKTMRRVSDTAHDVATIFERFEPDVVAIEAYEDFGGKHLREARRRWTTPMLIGALATVLPADVVRWQRASVVMSQYRIPILAWKRGDKRVMAAYPGVEYATNEHLRSAAAHGFFALAHERLRMVRQ